MFDWMQGGFSSGKFDINVRASGKECRNTLVVPLTTAFDGPI